MTLDHGDLFFVNRSANTYKIEAREIGEYLNNNQLADGSYFVNNGMLSIGNTGNDSLTTPIKLHSANSSDDTILDFDKHFVVQRRGIDATVSINFMEFKDSFLCNSGVGSGFDINNCDCLQLDFDEIGQRLPCDSGGIINDLGCLEINRCENSLIIFNGTNKGAPCLDVSICDDQGIDIGQGCIGVDMEYISSNITCGDPDSGLTNGQDCIAVDFDKVLAKINLGAIQSSDNSVKFNKNSNPNLVGNQDLRQGNVDLSVDWSQNPASHRCEGDKLQITVNNGPVQGTYDPCAGKNSQTINLNVSGSGGGNTGPVDCGEVKACYDEFFKEPDSCQEVGRMFASSITLRKAGTENRPGIVMGVEKLPIADDASYIGITGGVNARRMRLIGGTGWTNGSEADKEDHCGGSPVPDVDGGRSNLLTVAGGPTKIEDDLGNVSDGSKISTNPNRFLQIPAMMEDNTIGNKAVAHRTTNQIRYYNPNPAGGASAFDYFTADDDVNLANVDVENLLDSIVGTPSTGTTFESGGLLKWGRRNHDSCATVRYDDPHDFVPYPRIDPNAMADIHPYLVVRDYTEDSFYTEDHYDETITDPDDSRYWTGQVHLKPVSERSFEVVDVNKDAIQMISLLAHRRRKKQVQDLQDKVSTLESTVAAMESRLAALESP